MLPFSGPQNKNNVVLHNSLWFSHNFARIVFTLSGKSPNSASPKISLKLITKLSFTAKAYLRLFINWAVNLKRGAFWCEIKTAGALQDFQMRKSTIIIIIYIWLGWFTAYLINVFLTKLQGPISPSKSRDSINPNHAS